MKRLLPIIMAFMLIAGIVEARRYGNATFVGTVNIPHSTSLPGTCLTGDEYMDTDATSGQRFYLCESSNTWKLQGDGGGSGAFSDASDPIVQNTTTKDVHVGDGAGTLAGKLEIGGDADQPQLVIEGFSTQTDDILIIQNDADAEVFSVGSTGDVMVAGTVDGVDISARDHAATVAGDLDHGGITGLGDDDHSAYENELNNSAGLLGALNDETGSGLAVFNNSPTFVDDITLGTNDTIKGSILMYGDNNVAGAALRFHNAANEDTTEEYFNMEVNENNFNMGYTSDIDQFIFSNSGNFTATGNVAGATYTSDASVSDAELKFINTLSSNAQNQIDAKAPSTAPTFATSITGSYLTASEILITGASKEIISAAVATYPSLAELAYVKGVTSAIQTQMDLKSPLISPSFTTPSLGAATATSINKITITAPASGSTLTIEDGFTLTVDGNATVQGTNTGDVAEVNNLETVTTGIVLNEVPIGSAADDVIYKLLPSCSNATTSKMLYNNSTQTWSCGTDQTGGGGGGFAMQLPPQSAKLPASNPMGIDAGNLQWRGLFDDTTDECARWQGVLTPFTAGLDIDIIYSLETTSTSDVVELEVYVMCGKSDADMDIDSFDTVNNLSSGSVSTTAGVQAKLSATLSNDDSCAEDDTIIIKICRDADDTDTTADDVEYRGASLHE